MTIAFVCPDSFNNYELMEENFQQNENISKITCATTNSYELSKRYADKFNIEHYRETSGGKIFNLRKIVQCADKVVLFEKENYNKAVYSRTQKALIEANRLNKEVQHINFKDVEEKYRTFFKKIKLFKEIQQNQKLEGRNDYNILNVVRNENHEVGMHSNVLYSLLNPYGLHYQGDLFLKLFIKDVLIGDEDILIDIGDNIEVEAEESTYENRRIDFTIKSDTYYIGIEIKINASDLPNQISHYYEDLVKKAADHNIKKENVLIYYLTKFGTPANPLSYNYMEDYKKRSFNEHIFKWVENCQKEVKEITNLNEAFENYKTIVKKITNKYEGNIMKLEEFLLKEENNNDLKKEDYKNILDEIDKAQLSFSKNFITNTKKDFDNILTSSNNFFDIGISQNDYNIILRYLHANDNKLVCQVLMLDNTGNFDSKNIIQQSKKNNIFNILKGIDEKFNKGWSASYGVLELDFVRIQNKDTLVKKIKDLEVEIKSKLNDVI